jgi:hypothetical protein
MSELRVFLFVLPLVMMAACSTAPQPQAKAQPLTPGDAAPGFTLSSSEGGDLSLTEFRGESPVLLYFSMGPG